MTICHILLQAAAQSQGSMMSSLLPLILILVVMWFFMIRPQNKKQKEIQKAREALKPGDKVLTSGGIYGKLREVREDSFIIEISENVRIRVEKTAVFSAEPAASKKEEK